MWSNETLDEYKSLEYFVRKSFSFTKKGSHGKTLHSLALAAERNGIFSEVAFQFFFPQIFYESLKHSKFRF